MVYSFEKVLPPTAPPKGGPSIKPDKGIDAKKQAKLKKNLRALSKLIDAIADEL